MYFWQRRNQAPSLTLLLLAAVTLLTAEAWLTVHPTVARGIMHQRRSVVLRSSTNEDEGETPPERTSFDQAGQSLMDEEDRKRLEEMGDFDSNPAVSSK